MSDENRSETVTTRPEDLGVPAEHPQPEGPEASARPEEPPEGGAKGVLRDAIQKVVGEIAYHEREAQRHLRQAEELRRDLRDSFAFMLEREPGGKPGKRRDEIRPAEAAGPSTPEEAKPAAVVDKRPRPGKKRPGRKPKGG